MKINLDILKFWEASQKVEVLEVPNNIRSNVPHFYYIDQKGDTVTIACPYIDGVMVYCFGNKWYYEEAALKVMNLLPFI